MVLKIEAAIYGLQAKGFVIYYVPVNRNTIKLLLRRTLVHLVIYSARETRKVKRETELV